ncbi:hypothetical protein DY218_15610 [Streptomyces triticagri]|uniref:Uncharacterized protein n=1 Tax=Streptomyces triticagri TaxID=2293568 RepID=A0A372M4G5_9ACTN|nr:hypothetical protein [Streptomyces triticagri]RFU85824.1 hypothetical protein DY218_15610 [Streptomyces triticagri]
MDLTKNEQLGRLERTWRSRRGKALLICLGVTPPLATGVLLGAGLRWWAAAALALTALIWLLTLTLTLRALNGRDIRSTRTWQYSTTALCAFLLLTSAINLTDGNWLSASGPLACTATILTLKSQYRRGRRQRSA